MIPGEYETEGTETISEIAARLMGRGSPEVGEDATDEHDANHLEPEPVQLEEAKQSALCLSQFVGDNMGIFTEFEYRGILQLLEKVITLNTEDLVYN